MSALDDVLAEAIKRMDSKDEIARLAKAIEDLTAVLRTMPREYHITYPAPQPCIPPWASYTDTCSDRRMY
jgi:hypothetical protein